MLVKGAFVYFMDFINANLIKSLKINRLSI